MTFSWQQFVDDLAVEMGLKGWPNYFLVSPATMRVIKEQTAGEMLDHTHILGIPFEECPLSEMPKRATYLSLRGKIVWRIDVGEQYERPGQDRGQMGSED